MQRSRSNSTTLDHALKIDHAFDESHSEKAVGFTLHLRRYWDFITRHQRILTPLVLALLCLPIWFSLSDHGFNGRSDARYAVVAQDMAMSHDWLVPRYMGHVHLTKPPLVYWMESFSISLFGQSYFAVRLPSAICGTLVILLLYWFAKRVASRRVALFACGLYAIMPMTILPSRMTVTDATLNLCWLLVLVGGYLVRSQNSSRWGARSLLWLGVSLGFLAKGPVMLIPLGVVLVWWLLSPAERISRWVRIGYAIGAVLSLLPLIGWGVSVLVSEPEAAQIWWHETFDRAIGQGDHTRPIWFFVPILLIGCFPCSAMLMLPGINLRFRDAWARFRSGALGGFLGFAIIGPFVVYSLISGKLPSYLLPICAPLALLSAIMLDQWFTQQRPEYTQGRSLPEVRFGLLVGSAIFAAATISSIAWFYGPQHAWLGLAFVPVLVVSLLLVRAWGDRAMRAPMLALFIASWLVAWGVLEEIEDIALRDSSYGVVARQTFGPDGWSGRVGAYQLEAGVIYWDQRGHLDIYRSPNEVVESMRAHPGEALLVLTRADRWSLLGDLEPGLSAQGRIVHEWRQFPGAPLRYLVVFGDVQP